MRSYDDNAKIMIPIMIFVIEECCCKEPTETRVNLKLWLWQFYGGHHDLASRAEYLCNKLLFVVITIPSFPHACLIFRVCSKSNLTGATLVEHELLTFPGHLRSPPI
jgi:hypothetical protein